MLRLSSCSRGAESSSETGLRTPSPPSTIAASQCRLDLSMLSASARKTWPTSKLAQTRSMSRTAWQKLPARLASTAALIAPAEVPESTVKGQGAPAGTSSAMALRTPTW